MSADGAETYERWHAALRTSDEQAHRDEDSRVREVAVHALEQRLAQANGDRHALAAAVTLRDRIIADLAAAVAERDLIVARTEGELARLHELGAQPLHRKALRRLRAEVSRLTGRRG